MENEKLKSQWIYEMPVPNFLSLLIQRSDTHVFTY